MELQHVMGKTGEKTGMEHSAGRPGLQGCLINTERNRKLLGNIPHREFLGLSLVYLEKLHGPGKSIRYRAVDNSYLEKWEADESSLYETVRRRIEGTEEAFLEKMDAILGHDGILECGLGTMPVPLYVLSNKNLFGGAVHIMNKEILRHASDIMRGDFTILPSSVHELILVPDAWAAVRKSDMAELASIVREINDSQVPESDILSYHVYHYDKDTAEVTIAA